MSKKYTIDEIFNDPVFLEMELEADQKRIVELCEKPRTAEEQIELEELIKLYTQE
jgi:hypothetical protein